MNCSDTRLYRLLILLFCSSKRAVVALALVIPVFVFESCTQSIRFSSNLGIRQAKQVDRIIKFGNLTLLQRNIIEIAERWIGTPYCYGGSDEYVCADCSGFVKKVFSEAGILLPRTAKEQSNIGKGVPINEVIPGDLIFYDMDGSGSIDHVSLVIDDNIIIHATTSQGVIMQKINDNYWRKRAKLARRVMESV